MYETSESNMGTRGTITLWIGKRHVRLYNHFDSYMSGLGVKLLSHLKSLISRYGADEFMRKVQSVRIVDDSTPITLKDVTTLSAYSRIDEHVPITWSHLTWNMQGDLTKIIESGYAYDADSDDGEYHYTINFNDSWISCNDSPGYYFADIDKVLYCWSRDQPCFASRSV